MTDIVVRKPDIQGGEPCIAGTRVTVDAIQSWAASGFDNERIKQEYPGLTDDQIDAARAYKMPPVTDIDLDKLEALADAATPGPWWMYKATDARPHEIYGPVSWRPEEAIRGRIVDVQHYGSGLPTFATEQTANAAFIAAANPATIKSLIASARETAAEIDRLTVKLALVHELAAEGHTKAGCDGWRAQERCRQIANLSARAEG